MNSGYWFFIIHWLITCICLSRSWLYFWDPGRSIHLSSLKMRKKPLEGTCHNHIKIDYVQFTTRTLVIKSKLLYFGWQAESVIFWTNNCEVHSNIPCVWQNLLRPALWRCSGRGTQPCPPPPASALTRLQSASLGERLGLLYGDSRVLMNWKCLN